MRPRMTMRAALGDENLFAHPEGGLVGKSWDAWRCLLIAIMGEELTEEERELFKTLTDRDTEPGERVEEFWAISGPPRREKPFHRHASRVYRRSGGFHGCSRPGRARHAGDHVRLHVASEQGL